MKRFAGVAAIAFSAHAGLALAQPVFIESSERPPSRAERSAPDGAGPSRAPGRSERQMLESQRPDGPGRTQHGAQAEPSDPRAREPQRTQAPQREQAQRDRPDEQGRRASEPQRPDTRAPAPQTAQPQRPENRSSPTDTARPGTAPAPTQSETQQPGSTAQRPDATQPGTAQTAPSGSAPSARQSAQGEQAEPEKRRIADTVRERVERNEIRPVANLGVSVSVGAELPSRVQLQPVPSEIASIRPQYRDYRYTVSEREIVIVDPRSRRVVEVIERDGGRSGGNVFAVLEQRRDLRRWRRPDTVVFEQGVVLPPDAPYYDLPVELVERNPHWRGYRYVMTERDEVAIVEPRTRRVVEVIDKNAARSASGGGNPGQVASTAQQATSTGTGAGSRHEIVRIIMKDAQPGDINAVEHLKGTVLSREVVLRPLPAAAGEQDSQLRGYHYALLGDDVLIVDPGSREVIDVIE